jgi:hypothetical protein
MKWNFSSGTEHEIIGISYIMHEDSGNQCIAVGSSSLQNVEYKKKPDAADRTKYLLLPQEQLEDS